MKEKSTSTPSQCLENTIRDLFEAICHLSLHYCQTSTKLIEVSDLPEDDRKRLLKELEAAEAGSMATLLEIRKIAETSTDEKSQGSWIQRLFRISPLKPYQ